LDDITFAPMNSPKTAQIRRKIRILTWTLMLIWFAVSFGWVFFARALSFRIGDWEWSFWMAAQGSVLVFLLITVVNAWLVNRWERDLPPPAESPPEA
jgi:cation/acetate symporter